VSQSSRCAGWARVPAQTDAELSRRFRGRLAAQGRGPQRGTKVVAGYLTAEQALGRVDPPADPQAAAVVPAGACHQIAFGDPLLAPGHAVSHPDAASLVNTLLAGLVPHPSVEKRAVPWSTSTSSAIHGFRPSASSERSPASPAAASNSSST